MEWTKHELPAYSKVAAWVQANHHNLKFLAYLMDRNIFQLWNREYISALAREIISRIGNERAVEVCAGDGCLSHWLRLAGVNIVATDNYDWMLNRTHYPIKTVFPVQEIDAVEAVRKLKSRLVLASWFPSRSTLDSEILRLKPEVAIFIGDPHTCGTKNLSPPELGYRTKRSLCDRWNICRTDHDVSKQDFPHNSVTTIYERT